MEERITPKVLNYLNLSGIACFNNYMFPQNELGLTLPEFDEQMVALSKKIKAPYNYLIHGKFLLNGTKEEIIAEVQRVCSLAVNEETPMIIGISTVPLGTDLTKVDAILETVNKFGVYK